MCRRKRAGEAHRLDAIPVARPVQSLHDTGKTGESMHREWTHKTSLVTVKEKKGGGESKTATWTSGRLMTSRVRFWLEVIRCSAPT